jgi:hypothetical protein
LAICTASSRVQNLPDTVDQQSRVTHPRAPLLPRATCHRSRTSLSCHQPGPEGTAPSHTSRTRSSRLPSGEVWCGSSGRRRTTGRLPWATPQPCRSPSGRSSRVLITRPGRACRRWSAGHLPPFQIFCWIPLCSSRRSILFAILPTLKMTRNELLYPLMSFGGEYEGPTADPSSSPRERIPPR